MTASAARSQAAGSAREALTAAADALRAAGADSPRLDAELVLAEATGWERARFAADPEAGIDPPAARRFGEMLRRRLRREPLAYVLGRRGFRHIELAVDRRVLIPRPETELLVEVALELRPASVIDVGTGSGAVALALATELPGTEVAATDTSAAALEVARANAQRLGLAERVAFEPGSLPPGRGFDLLLANLPYVAAGDFERLEPEIREWEPAEALVPGPTGYEAFEALAGQLAEDSHPPAAVALEVGEEQAAAVAGLLRRAGYEETAVRPDLAGIERVVTARR
jgi:release factor glutamine methyltransferase